MTMPFASCDDWDERAHRLYEEGAYDQALEVLRDGLARFPGAAVLHTGLGYVRLAREEWIWAKHAFEQAICCDPTDADAWVGLGETLLKFGEVERALECFSHLARPAAEEEGELHLAVGRALCSEGLLEESRDCLRDLAEAHPNFGEAAAALGYALHLLGEEKEARQSLRRALWLDAELHEARIYLAHLLYQSGSLPAALRELERVPPQEHCDLVGIWRVIELCRALRGWPEDDPRLAPWRARLIELEAEPDPLDHLFAEVEAAFETSRDA
jgi:tetratricopeptide (TPR) repeat protein